MAQMRSRKDAENQTSAETSRKQYTDTMDKLYAAEEALKAMQEKSSQLEIALAVSQKSSQKYVEEIAVLNAMNSELVQKNRVDNDVLNQQMSESFQKNRVILQSQEQKYSELSMKSALEQKVFSSRQQILLQGR